MESKIEEGRSTVLRGITWDHPRGYQPLYSSSDRYERQKNIRILWDKRSLKDFGDSDVNLLAEKYDLLVIDHPHIAIVAERNCLLKLDELLDDDELALFADQSVGASYKSYNYAGHQWALPIDAACQVAAYRHDLMEQKIPETWEEVFALAVELQNNGKHIGIALCPTDCNCTFLTLSAQFNDPPVAGREEFVNHASGVEILNLMLFIKKIAHPDCLDWNPIGLYEHMIAHDDVVYSPLGFGYVNYTMDTGNSNLKYAGIPGKSGALLGGAGIAISSHCKNVDAAVNYIKWICNPGYQKTKYFEEGGQPAQLDAWKDAAVNKKTGGFFSETLSTMDLAYMRPRMTQWPAFQELLGAMIHDFLLYEKSAKVTIMEINAAYKRGLALK